MFRELQKITLKYQRISKLNNIHNYTRIKTIAVFECDCCHSVFQRAVSKMDHRRLNNDYFHVCSNCDVKRFAQKKGAQRRRVWNLSVDTDISIDRL